MLIFRVILAVSLLAGFANGNWLRDEINKVGSVFHSRRKSPSKRGGTVVGTTTKVPEQIHLTLSNTHTEMVVQWAVVDGPSTGCFVEWGTSSSSLSHRTPASGSSYTLNNNGYPSYTSPMLYLAKMTGLQSGNSVYYYRVGCDASSLSPTYAFKSHPGVGPAAGPVTFHIIGDLGQTENSQNTLNELLDNEKALSASHSGGIISMGDISYANGNEPIWDTYGKMAQSATATIPYVTTLGNHEWFDDNDNLFTAYKARFFNPPLPGTGKTELYYSFNSGLVHWVMVAGYCTEMKSVSTQPCLAPGSPELKWLQRDLASVDKSVTPWTFVVFHQPYMNSNTAHDIASEGAPMQQAIEDTLYNAKVDMVFSGHVHAYERSCPAYKNNCVAGAPTYVTIGDGGNAEGLASNWVEPQPAWSVYRQASYGHGELTVYNSTHTLWQWHQNQDLSPVVADQLWLVKPGTRESYLRAAPEEFVPRTGRTKFAENERGRRAKEFNDKVSATARSSK